MSYSDQDLEKALQQSLQRVEPPPGLLQRVMDETATHGPRKRPLLEFPWQKVWIGALAASLAFGAVLVGGVEHRNRAGERARAEHDFARSIEITDRVMEQTRQRVQRAGVALDN